LALNEQEKLSYKIFEFLAKRSIQMFPYRFHNYPVNQMSGEHTQLISFMINIHNIDNEKDAWDYIARIEKFKSYLDQVVINLKTREEKKIIAPSFVYPKVILECRNILKGYPFKGGKERSPLWNDFLRKLKPLKNLTTEKKISLQKAFEKALIKSVQPGYNKLIAYLLKLQQNAALQGAAADLPEGHRFYDLRLNYHTSTFMTATQIHRLGKREVKRIHQEMILIKEKVGFKGDLNAFFNFMKTSPKFRYENNKKGKAEYLKNSAIIIDNMRKNLSKLFNVQPKANIIVKAVEPFRERSAGETFYKGPSADGKRPGTYYINLYDTASLPKYELEAMAYHEGIPGHHMQIAISQELENIPRFRKYNWLTAYSEGWALYSEMIPKEIGFYQDPYADFGRLSKELWRACRLVVDTGLHLLRWSRERSIQYLLDNAPANFESARKSIERYIVMPGQATAYKIGMMKILELRQKSKEILGKKFNIKNFHDEVLRSGAVPLDILEQKIVRWISATQKNIH